MNPVISPQRFLEAEDVIETYQGLTCWLLYCDMHRTLWKYIRENWWAIDEMSSRRCLICVLDKPSTWDDPFWDKANIKPDFEDLLSSVPFNRNDHLRIARSLGVDYTALPAFVFFSSIQSKEKLVIKIDGHSSYDDLTSTFSKVFDCVRSVTSNSSFGSGEAYERSAAVQVRARCQRQLASEIRKRRIASVVKRIVTPTTLISTAQVAAAL